MSTRTVLSLIACISALSCLPAGAAMPGKLQASHPRLILTPESVAQIRENARTDKTAAKYLEMTKEMGALILDQKPAERGPIGPRLLDTSRGVLFRLTTLGLLYQLDGDKKWADRAIAEMRAVAGFQDWNPSTFLDLAEMTNAMALGYDWVYDAMTPADRGLVRGAIVRLGLKESLVPYHTKEWWTITYCNWNNVCNGSMIIGSLAVADEEPEIANTVYAYARKNLSIALGTYAPDGAWPEGMSYWTYATSYTIYTAYALKSALGTDTGIMDMPGIRRTGCFPQALTGPTGMVFNFSDSFNFAIPRTCLYALAKWYHDPAYAYMARTQRDAPGLAELIGKYTCSFDLIFYSPIGSAKDIADFPLDYLFKRVAIATMRSSRTDPNATFVATKAGNNAATHGHLDAGSFVMESDGVRWAYDLGSDDYNLPGYWDPRRWNYYRMTSAGHNTLVLDGVNQDPAAYTPITTLVSKRNNAFAIADLTRAYAPSGAKRVQRGIALIDNRRRVLVQDEIRTKNPVSVMWSMHTQTKVAIDPTGAVATLTKDGKTLEARILSPSNARFTVEALKLDPPQAPVADDEKTLILRLPEKTNETTVAVLLCPGAKDRSTPNLTPLEKWK